MEDKIKKVKTVAKIIKLDMILLIIILLISLYILVNNEASICIDSIISFYSTIAGVLAGIYALTIAGYSFFQKYARERIDEDETLEEVVNVMLYTYFFLFSLTSWLTFFTIILSVGGIIFNIFAGLYIKIIFFGFIFTMTGIIILVVNMFNPMNIERISKIIYQEYKNEYEGAEENNILLFKFLWKYNLLEREIDTQYRKILPKNKHNEDRINNFIREKYIRSLVFDKKLTENYYYIYKDIVAVRNIAVHSVNDVSVPDELYNYTIKLLYKIQSIDKDSKNK